MSVANKNLMTAVAAATAVVGAGFLFLHSRSRDEMPPIPSQLLKSCYSDELKLAVQLAKRAGENMIGYIESKGTSEAANFSLHIETKSGSADFCTKVDVENEKLIMDGIQERFPSHEIIGEEATGTGEVPKLTKNPTWIIDPIDGTTNFSSGLSMTCVSIGFCVGGHPVMGVIYAPASNEWYLGVKGFGAYRNGIRILQHTSTATKLISKAMICCEFGYSRKQDEIDVMLGAVSRILARGCRAIRQLGSGCLDLCYVASGRLDIVYAGVVNEGWKPWDYAAGLVICQEAGCVMESIDQTVPGEFDLYSKSILCGVSRELVNECRTLLDPKEQ
eukprot:scaffold22607_cov123-Cylindrotheca_fusiformis.AAC.5